MNMYKGFLLGSLFCGLFAGPSAAMTEIKYQFWGSPAEIEVWKKIVDNFEAEHKDINVTVEVSDWDSYWEKLRVLMAGGSPPDIFAMDAPLYPDWQSRGVLLNMQPYIDKDPKVLEGIYPLTLEAYKTPNGMFGLPRDFQTIVLYYNKDMFDAAKVDYPTDKWTYQDFRDAAKKLTIDKDGDGKTDQWGFWAEALDPEPYWGPVIWAHGGDIVDLTSGKTLINSDAAKTGFQFISDMLLGDKSLPTEEQLKQYGADGFQAGIAAMGVSGHWSVPDYNTVTFKWDVAPMPIGPAGRATGVNSAGFVISKESKNPDAAWEFVKYATGESVATGPAYLEQSGANINQKMFVDALSYAHVKPVFKGYEEWSAAVGDALHTVWSGEAKLEDALNEAVAGGDAAMAKNK
jgi:multiple sugar transport system substrate-binding protein